MAPDCLIALSGIDFSYANGRTVFKDFSFRFFSDQRSGLIGSNGSGKTTLLQLVMGLLKPKRGVIELFGKPCRTDKDFREARLKIGFVFQDANDQLFCPTVGDDIAFGPLNLGKTRFEADQIVAETLQILKLEDFKDRVTYGLSDGEKKIVAIGTALAMRPQMLILDEPTTCLDEEACGRISEVLLGCGLPYLIVAHDRPFLDKVTENLILLNQGQISEAPPSPCCRSFGVE